MKKNLTADEVTRDILTKIRTLQENSVNHTEKGLLKEDTNEDNNEVNAIAITDDIRFGDNVLSSQIEQFRSAVESGAQFNKPEQGKVAEAPLIFMPKTNNLVFSGIIPCLNNLKWQFVLKTNTGNGCFIWSDGMILSDENLKIIQKLYGFYKNWKEQWFQESADLESIAKMFNRD